MFSESQINPNISNILEKYKNKNVITEASKKYKERGFLVAMPGLHPCPWCDSDMHEFTSSYEVVCENNPLHKAIWLPWGG